MEEQRKTVRLADIAERMGVSIVTVSNALQGRRGVGEALRQKIEEQAKEMGYHVPTKNNKKATLKVGVVIAKEYVITPKSFYMELYQQLVAELAKKNGIALLEILDTKDPGSYPELLENETVNGIVVIGEIKDPFTEEMMSRSKVPVVFMDYYKNIPDGDFVLTDGYFGGYAITKYLLDRGMTDLDFVGTPNTTSSISDRYMGYRRALLKHGIPFDESKVIFDRSKDNKQYQIHLPERIPEGFVCNNDYVAAQIVDLLIEQGYRVPEDVSVIGFDNYNGQNKNDIKITTYAIDRKEFARAVVEVLCKRIRGVKNRNSYDYRILEGRIMAGNSVR